MAPSATREYSAGGEPPDTILKVLDDPAAPPSSDAGRRLYLADSVTR